MIQIPLFGYHRILFHLELPTEHFALFIAHSFVERGDVFFFWIFLMAFDDIESVGIIIDVRTRTVGDGDCVGGCLCSLLEDDGGC